MRQLLFALVCAVTMIALSSCSKDDSEPQSSIVGKWEYINIGEDKYDYSHDIIEFEKKGDFTYSMTDFEETIIYGGKYEITGDKLALILVWREDEDGSKWVNGNVICDFLIIKDTLLISNEYDSITFTRVK